MPTNTVNSRPEPIWEVMGDVRVAGRFHADVADLAVRRRSPAGDPRPRRANVRFQFALPEGLARFVELLRCHGWQVTRRPASADC